MSETIGRQAASYRQGLVLGLTMAEIMLLLVFCMLIAVGVGLANERAKLLDTMLRLKKVEAAAAADRAIVDTIKRNPRLAELLAQATGSASQREIDEFWRKLVESNDVVAKLGHQGVSLIALKEEGDYFAKMQRLLKDGIDPDKIARGLALASAIDTKSTPKLTPQQVAALIEKGIAASKPQKENDRGGHNWPPIINLSEAGGYYFATGSAVLTPDFAMALRTIVIARLLQIAESFDVDVIEVIGHTDEQPVTNRVSNLDRHLSSVTLGGADAGVLQWADNAGLGLARALAVVKVLSSDARLGAFRILPLSGAQLIDTDGRLTRWDEQGDVRERRRIEIRMRKSS
jgi:outer membrane protein OmpA-like peptidoglycan-associated protein